MRRTCTAGAVALVLVAGGPLPAQLKPQPPGAPAARTVPPGTVREAPAREPVAAPAPGEPLKLRVVPLREASAAEAARVLREIFNPSPIRAGGGVAVAVLEPVNAVAVWGREADLELAVDLLRGLEGLDPGGKNPRGEVRVLKLGRLDPDDALERSLQLVFRGPGSGGFVLDRGRRVVVASADRATLATAEALLKRLGNLPQPKPDAPRVGQAGAAGPAEESFVIELRDQPWGRVFEWLTDVSGLPVIARPNLAGTVTLSSRSRRYTLAEIIDLLNEHLQPRYLLVRRERSFTLVPGDEKVDLALVRSVRAEDLDGLGRTELVTVAFPLDPSLPAGEIAASVKKLLGPFGEAVADPRGHQLVVRDLAGNLQRIRQTLRPDGRGRGEQPAGQRVDQPRRQPRRRGRGR